MSTLDIGDGMQNLSDHDNRDEGCSTHVFITLANIFESWIERLSVLCLKSNLVKTDLRNSAVSFEIRRFPNAQAQTTV